MERITIKQLETLMGYMGNAMDIPHGPVWTRSEDGKRNTARIGALKLQQGSRTYGNAWTISQIVNDAGGESTLLRGSTARELYDAMQAWLHGYSHAKRGH
jgi:hypothetical protein